MSLEQIELKTAFYKMKTAEVKYVRVMQSLRPSFNLPITIRREGSRWVCVVESDPDITNCPVAYGGSPAQAMQNFDILWNGGGVELQPPEDDEEQF